MVHKPGVHACPECHKTFTRLEYVSRHRRLKHLGIRPWSCVCGVSYARSDLLCRHKRKCTQVSAALEPQLELSSALPTTSKPSLVLLPSPVGAPSFVEPSGSSEVFPSDLHEGAPPPSYDQAIGYNPAPHISNRVWVQLPGNPQQSSHDSLQSGIPNSHAAAQPNDISLAPLKSNILITHAQQLPVWQDAMNSSDGPSHHAELFADDSLHQNHHSSSDDDDPATLSHPASHLVRYSDPTFFVTEEPASSPYYLNPDLWVIAFLCQRGQGFNIPTVGTLSRYLRKATMDMLSIIPMIHVPTLKASAISIHLGYALCVAGAATDNSEHAIAFANQSLLYKRPLVQRDFELETNPFDFRFELLQTLLTYQFLGIFNRLDHQRQRAIQFNQILVQNFRGLALTQIVQDAPDYLKLVLEGRMSLDLAWRSWAKYETHKRTIFLVLMSAYQLENSPGLMIEDANVPLPCHEEAWTAPDAESWLIAMYRHTSKCLTDGKAVIGEETIPNLIEALGAMSLELEDGPTAIPKPFLPPKVAVNPEGSTTALSPGRQATLHLSPSVRAISSMDPPHIRQLGHFANLVLSHCNKMRINNPCMVGRLVQN